MFKWPAKDPDEILDYDIDWTAGLLSADEIDAGSTSPADTIVTSTFTLPAGSLTASSTSNSTTHTKIWLSGGVLGITYQITNEITTAAGRKMDRTVEIKIKSK